MKRAITVAVSVLMGLALAYSAEHGAASMHKLTITLTYSDVTLEQAAAIEAQVRTACGNAAVGVRIGDAPPVATEPQTIYGWPWTATNFIYTTTTDCGGGR